MFLHNDIYCKHLIEALIKLRNILDQQEMYKTWAFREFVAGSRMELTQHRSHAPTMISLKFSRETSFVPGIWEYFILYWRELLLCFLLPVLKVMMKTTFCKKIRKTPRRVTWWICICCIRPDSSIRSTTTRGRQRQHSLFLNTGSSY